jgi:hypothetical protein
MLARTYVEQFFQNQYCKSNKIITKWRFPYQILMLKLHNINPSTPELNPSAQRCLMRFFKGDFASWTVHFVNVCMKNQQMQQYEYINYRLTQPCFIKIKIVWLQLFQSHRTIIRSWYRTTESKRYKHRGVPYGIPCGSQ